MKKTPQNEEALAQLIEGGLSLTRAAQSLGMHHKTTHRWKAEDEVFATRIEQAEARFIAEMTANIAEQSKGDWRAGVELLARRFPSEFSKPESRVAVNVITDQSNGKISLEQLAKSPNFLGHLEGLHRRLKKRQEEAEAIEIEAEAVG